MRNSLTARFGRTGNAALILAGSNIFEQVLRMLRNMLLARMIAPHEFGVSALIAAAISTVEAVTTVGIRQAVIQIKTKQPNDLLQAAFVYSAGRGILLTGLLFILASHIAQFFALEEHIFLFRISLLIILFNSLWSPAQYLAEKSLNYTPIAIAGTSATICGVATSVGLSFYRPEASSMVYGMIVEGGIRMASTYLLSPFKPTFRFSKESWSSLSRFSKGIAGVPALTLLYLRADIFFLGKLATPALTGTYSMCSTVAAAPFAPVSMLNRIMMPACAKLHNQGASLAPVVDLILRVQLFFSIPLLAFVFLAGKGILHLVLGPFYADYGTLFAFQFMNQLFFATGFPVGTVFLSTGNPADLRPSALVRVLIAIGLCAPLFAYLGGLGIALAVATASGTGLAILVYRLKTIHNIRLLEVVRRSARIIYTSLAYAGLTLLGRLLLNMSFPVYFSLCLLGLIAVYLINFKMLRAILRDLQQLRRDSKPEKPNAADASVPAPAL